MVFRLVQLSALHSFAKVLYPCLGIEPLCPLVLYGTYRTGLSNFAWLWPLGRAHKGKNSKAQAFYDVFFIASITPTGQNHVSLDFRGTSTKDI